MKIHILSDLHLECGDFVAGRPEADVVVLAGDISKGAHGVTWSAGAFSPERTIYLAGNHEFYGGTYNNVMKTCRAVAAETGVHLLENDAVTLDGVKFLGCTLWSDFKLDGDGDRRREAMQLAGQAINDFHSISVSEPFGRRRSFSPIDANYLHQRSRDFLERELSLASEGPTVVITHFLPCPRSIAERYRGSPLNAYFCSDLTALIDATQPDVWIHGHTHESCDYEVGKTRVVCNPRGYAPDALNPNFDSSLVIEL